MRQVSDWLDSVEKRHGPEARAVAYQNISDWDGGPDVTGAFYDQSVLNIMETAALEYLGK